MRGVHFHFQVTDVSSLIQATSLRWCGRAQRSWVLVKPLHPMGPRLWWLATFLLVISLIRAISKQTSCLLRADPGTVVELEISGLLGRIGHRSESSELKPLSNTLTPYNVNLFFFNTKLDPCSQINLRGEDIFQSTVKSLSSYRKCLGIFRRVCSDL